MSRDEDAFPRNTEIYYDFYRVMFDAMDVTSIFWQPVLKAVGRTQLEYAALQARQARAIVAWGHQLMAPTSPFDLIHANARFWAGFMHDCADAAPRVAAAVETAASGVVAPVVVYSSERPRQGRRVRWERTPARGATAGRKVA
jgi:hypothetical protein